MIDKVVAGSARPGTSRGLLAAGLVATLAVAVLAVHAGAPFLFERATLRSEIATQVRATTGLAVTSRRVRFDVLPRPHVVMSDVHVSDPSNAFVIDAPSLVGDVRLLPLVVGRIELSAATLNAPTLRVDLDAQPIDPHSTIGRALYPLGGTASGDDQRLGSVTLVGGTAVLNSRALSRTLAVSDVDVTVDWRNLESSATLTGSLRVENTAANVAAWVAQPSSLMRGDHSAVTLDLHSAPLELSASGDLASTDLLRFKGHVNASAPSLTAMLGLGVRPVTLPAPFANLTLAGDSTVSIGRDNVVGADLQGLHLRADGNDYEGTLAFQFGVRTLLSGTLAADQLTLAPFVARAPPFLDGEGRWTRNPLPSAQPGTVDIDLRVSAAHMRLVPVTVDEAALSIMTRGDRTEIALNEGTVDGGTVKGRVSLGQTPGGLNMRGAGSVAGIDAGALGWDLFGRQLVAGTLSGSGSLEGTGDTPASLLAHLQGWVKGTVTGGEISGVNLGRGLAAAQRGSMDIALASLRNGRTPVSTLTLGIRLSDGVAAVEDAAMKGPDADLTVTGETNIAAQTCAFRVLASVPPGLTPATLRFALTGWFNRFLVGPDLGHAPTRP